jgi:hypothetical protein
MHNTIPEIKKYWFRWSAKIKLILSNFKNYKLKIKACKEFIGGYFYFD